MAKLPQARVVQNGKVTFDQPAVPLRERMAELEDGLGPRARAFLGALIGLWPVTAIVVMMIGLAWLSAMQSSP